MATNRLQLYEYAGGKCPFCGREVQDCLKRFNTASGQFEFHHVDPKRKHPDYDNLIRRNLSSEQLDEIDKCVLLCRTCHGLFHAQNLTAKGVIRQRIQDSRRQQTVNARGLVDWQEKRLVLFTEEDNELAIFLVQLRGMASVIRIRRDLEKELFSVFIPATRRTGSLLVRGANKTPLFRVDRESGQCYQIQMDVRCPFAKLELHGEPGEPIIWVRNGKMLTLGGEVRDRGIVTMHGLKYSECPKP